jgi:hypothetical protein
MRRNNALWLMSFFGVGALSLISAAATASGRSSEGSNANAGLVFGTLFAIVAVALAIYAQLRWHSRRTEPAAGSTDPTVIVMRRLMEWVFMIVAASPTFLTVWLLLHPEWSL